MEPLVLVVDDDDGVRYTLREILEESGIQVFESKDGKQALDWLAEHEAHLVITDLAMPVCDGMELLAQIQTMDRPPKVIMITAHGSERHAVEAMKLGAMDYFAKPFDMEQVLAVIQRALSSVRLGQENEALRAQLALSRHMVFASEAMKKVSLLVQRVASKDVTVLITGDSGTGKERIAEALVAGSPRKDGPFIRFNCAAMAGELAEAELFGHSRGAFTGATRARSGLFREATGGTLLLDEVGELSPAVQGKLLRVLQERTVRPVGEEREQSVDVRVLAATNRKLEQEVEEGRFRQDLFYRLNVVQIHLPPLRERPEDLPALIDHFLRKFAERFGTGPLHLAPGVRTRLASRDYPGNVRELEHQIERLAALSSDGQIDELSLGALDGASDSLDSRAQGLKSRVEVFERSLIAAELRRCQQNRSEAARRLQLSRVTLLDKMKKYGLR